MGQSSSCEVNSHTSKTVSLRSIIILPSHLCLGLPGGPFPSDFPTKMLYASLIYADLTGLILFDEE